MPTLFSVTYEIVTEESAMRGDYAENGFISKDSRLRDAVADLMETRTSRVSGVECIECSDSRASRARWITVYNGMEYESGGQESRSLHIPDHVTPASRMRLARLCGAIK